MTRDTQLHDKARSIIGERWHKAFNEIIATIGMSRSELRCLQQTEQYEMQVWAEYGRMPYIFSKHAKKFHCIQHMKHYFGINTETAKRILGNDWTAPEPVQLTIF